jgi:putative CocE/NonD family hydrolase
MVNRRRIWRLLALAGAHLVFILAPLIVSAAQTTGSVEEYLAANCTREEYSVQMRDGVRLFTVVFVPLDMSKTYPILLERTPFGAGAFGGEYYRGTLGPNMALVRAGYIVVRQEVRGTYRSEGVFSYLTPYLDVKRGPSDVDESTDAYDTIEWLLANVRHHNGRVGMWGLDFAGFSAAAGMIGAHPALKAVSPQSPVTDLWFDTVCSNGAFKFAHAFRLMTHFGESTSGQTVTFNTLYFDMGLDLYRFFLDMGSLSYVDRLYLQGRRSFWNECAAHPNYDQFWRSRNILPHLSKTAPAVMTVGGWFDDENLCGAPACYRAVEEKNPGVFNILVMGPWDHAAWIGQNDTQNEAGGVSFGANTADFYQQNIELAFFEYFLKDRGRRTLPEAYVFETGSNTWRAFDRWPPKETRSTKFYLHADGRLSLDPPGESREEWDEFVSDPASPVPVVRSAASWFPQGFMMADQRFLTGRGDVLVYTTDALERDMTVVGPLKAELWVSTSQGDADWVVKLVDVFPPGGDDRFPDRMVLKGYHMLVRAGVLRGRFRTSAESPAPFVAGDPARVTVELHDICHTFRKGHRIMVHVQSSWFPFIDRNPQKYVENIFRAADEDFSKATHRVYRSAERASCIELGVLGKR